MSDDLITIATFQDPLEANISKTKLESEGIKCFIADEELMGSPLLRTVIGQVRLQVLQSDIKRAKTILNL